MTTAAPARPTAAASATDLLSAWEWGAPRSLPERAIGLLAALFPYEPGNSLVELTAGERDLYLMEIHRMLFGPRLECLLRCPGCSADLELELSVDQLLELSVGASSSSVAEGPAEVEEAGWRVRFGLVTVKDLLETRSSRSREEARDLLLRLCVLEVTPPGGEPSHMPPGGLPAEVESVLIREMERRDALGTFTFRSSCPECDHTWDAPFDILSFLWIELDGWAHRTMTEVHLLASAYGWSESEILGLTAWRRQAYLQMSRHG